MDTERLTQRIKESNATLVVVVGLVVLSMSIVVAADVSITTQWQSSDGGQTSPAYDQADDLSFYEIDTNNSLNARYDNGTLKNSIQPVGEIHDVAYATSEEYVIVGFRNGSVNAYTDSLSLVWSTQVMTSTHRVNVEYDWKNDKVWTAGQQDSSADTQVKELYVNGSVSRTISIPDDDRVTSIAYSSGSNSVFIGLQFTGVYEVGADGSTSMFDSSVSPNQLDAGDDYVVVNDNTIYVYNSSTGVEVFNDSVGDVDGVGIENASGKFAHYDTSGGTTFRYANGTVIGSIDTPSGSQIPMKTDSNGDIEALIQERNGAYATLLLTNITGGDGAGGGGGAGGDEALRIETRDYLEHNTTVPFRIYYEPDDSTQINVTTNATVTVENASVVTVDQTAGSMTSTNDTSINQVTWVNATYQGENANKSVVVANETIENVDILPPMQKWTATIGDDNTLVIVVATAVAAGVALYATSLAGLGAFALVIIGGWLGGFTADHTVISALLVTLFVGLNVSQLVEFDRR